MPSIYEEPEWENPYEDGLSDSSREDADEEFSEADADLFGDDERLEYLPCPHCGEMLYEEVQQCPYCKEWVVLRNTNGATPLSGKTALVVLFLILLLLALMLYRVF